MLCIPTSRRRKALQALLGNVQRMRLFVSDSRPAEGDGASTYLEASGNGYAPITLQLDDWSIDAKDGKLVATCPQQTFTLSGPLGKVYGYLLESEGELVGAERFGEKPFAVRKLGDQIKITPEIVLTGK